MDKRLQLYYWDGGNFGDDLNVWLWGKLLPDVVDVNEPYKGEGSRPLFVGIGTILADHLSDSRLKVVFGSGVGYHDVPQLDENWKTYFVRGEQTAKELSLDKCFAITDPAALIRVAGLPEVAKRYKYSFMPHHTSLVSIDWLPLCESLGIEYIDPTADMMESIIKIQASEVVLAEAMHAAIVADALRVPWVPINFHGDYINSFKWNDWCGSLDLRYQPHTLGLGKHGRLIKRSLPLLSQQSVQSLINVPLARRAFKKIIRHAQPVLSSDAVIKSVTAALQDQVQKLKEDFADGIISA